MIVFDNIIFSLQRVGGISTVWGSLIQNSLAKGLDIAFLEHQRALENEVRANIDLSSQPFLPTPHLPIRAHQYRSPALRSLSDKFIFHSSYYRTSSNPKAVNIVTVHDFTYSFFMTGLQRKLHQRLSYCAINRADHIVCVSENTRNDLFRLLPHIAKDRVSVIHNGISEQYHPIDNPDIKYADYVLYVGRREGYKNFAFAVNAVKQSGHKLLVVGMPLSRAERHLLDDTLGADRWLSEPYPTVERLNELYNSVVCLLYPSLYEGFGMPVIEAQRAGCPVIAFEVASIPEVMGKSPLLVPHDHCEQLPDKFAILNSQAARSEIIAAGIENSRRFSLEAMTEAYHALYASIK